MSANELNTDKLVADLKRVVRDSEELLLATAGAAGDKAQEVRERLTDALETAKRTCHRLEEKAVEGLRISLCGESSLSKLFEEVDACLPILQQFFDRCLKLVSRWIAQQSPLG